MLPKDKKQEIIRDNFQLTGEVKMSAERLRKKISNTLDKVHDEALKALLEEVEGKIRNGENFGDNYSYYTALTEVASLIKEQLADNQS